MDTSDRDISFDEHGICNHCTRFDEFAGKIWLPNEEGTKTLENLVTQIKKEGQGSGSPKLGAGPGGGSGVNMVGSRCTMEVQVV